MRVSLFKCDYLCNRAEEGGVSTRAVTRVKYRNCGQGG